MVIDLFSSFPHLAQILIMLIVAGTLGYLLSFFLIKKKWEVRYQNMMDKMEMFEAKFEDLTLVKDKQGLLFKSTREMTEKINEIDALLGMADDRETIHKTLNSLNFVSAKDFADYQNRQEESIENYKRHKDMEFTVFVDQSNRKMEQFKEELIQNQDDIVSKNSVMITNNTVGLASLQEKFDKKSWRSHIEDLNQTLQGHKEIIDELLGQKQPEEENSLRLDTEDFVEIQDRLDELEKSKAVSLEKPESVSNSSEDSEILKNINLRLGDVEQTLMTSEEYLEKKIEIAGDQSEIKKKVVDLEILVFENVNSIQKVNHTLAKIGSSVSTEKNVVTTSDQDQDQFVGFDDDAQFAETAVTHDLDIESDNLSDDESSGIPRLLVESLSIKDLPYDPKNPDDLTLIKGVGPFTQKKVNRLGIYTFDQLVSLSSEDIERVNEAINFYPGRINQDDWIGQVEEIIKSKVS